MVVYVPKESFISAMENFGYEFVKESGSEMVFQRGDSELYEIVTVPIKVIYGREFVIVNGKCVLGSTIEYDTGKSVPGWYFCKETGDWYGSEEEYYERCPEGDFEEFCNCPEFSTSIEEEVKTQFEMIRDYIQEHLNEIDDIMNSVFGGERIAGFNNPSFVEEAKRKYDELKRVIEKL